MTYSELKQYMSMLVDMEKHCYLQQELITRLQNQTKGLAWKGVFTKPEEPKILTFTFMDLLVILLQAAVVGFFGGVILAFLLCFILEAFFYPQYETWFPFKYMTTPYPLYYMMIALTFAVVAIFGIITGIVGVKAHNSDAEEKYTKELAQYNLDVENDKKRGLQELKQKLYLEKEIEVVSEKHRQSKQLLTELYALNVLYPKYRNFVAVSSILEYLQSGRCTTLEGHEGAYNIFETESRLDKIILKLDDVIRQLSRVASTQMVLYNAVQESNQNINALMESSLSMATQVAYMSNDIASLSYNIDQIKSNSAVASYNAQRIAEEIRYRNIKDNLYTYM
ncbi:MAG: hypothetical protein IKL88_08385 [Erysipelotrichales bacterium]|nr:hypothetical protein [Erysipelotrichales bacterium]